jgi:hypothetical protein
MGSTADTFGETLNEKATAMDFRAGRRAGHLCLQCRAVLGRAGKQGRDLTAKLQNDDREEIWGFESKAQRPTAAEMGLQASTRFAAVEGAVYAYGTITGENWEPYVAPADNLHRHR